MNSENCGQTVRRILSYLLRHPNAQDTLEGIAEWWIMEEQIYQKYREVDEALNILVEENLVVKTQYANSDTLYSLNAEKKALIETIVEDSSEIKFDLHGSKIEI
jgi:Fe2+ or Zn2+ uptake regulation protein